MANNGTEPATSNQTRGGLRTFLIQDWPYLGMLILALCGVVFTSIAREAAVAYWEVLVPIFGAICIFTRLRESEDQELRLQEIGMEALHWGAVLSAMYLLSVADVSHAMSTVASGLAVLTVLALGTFTAGLNIRAWRICIVGVVLGLGVPIIAWLTETALLVTLGGIVLAAVAFMLYLHYARENKTAA